MDKTTVDPNSTEDKNNSSQISDINIIAKTIEDALDELGKYIKKEEHKNQIKEYKLNILRLINQYVDKDSIKESGTLDFEIKLQYAKERHKEVLGAQNKYHIPSHHKIEAIIINELRDLNKTPKLYIPQFYDIDLFNELVQDEADIELLNNIHSKIFKELERLAEKYIKPEFMGHPLAIVRPYRRVHAYNIKKATEAVQEAMSNKN